MVWFLKTYPGFSGDSVEVMVCHSLLHTTQKWKSRDYFLNPIGKENLLPQIHSNNRIFASTLLMVSFSIMFFFFFFKCQSEVFCYSPKGHLKEKEIFEMILNRRRTEVLRSNASCKWSSKQVGGNRNNRVAVWHWILSLLGYNGQAIYFSQSQFPGIWNKVWL